MEAFNKDGVVPDVIDFAPPACLQVHYGNTDLQPGNNLTPTQVKDTPKIDYSAGEEEFYTLVMIDPDAPSKQNPQMREILHWLMVNIPGNDVNKGEEIAEYIGSGAPKGSGFHRYVILLLKQRNGKGGNFEDLPKISKNSVEGRRKFNTKEFCQKYTLEIVAGNFFQAEWDEYVPTLHKQLGFKPPTQ